MTTDDTAGPSDVCILLSIDLKHMNTEHTAVDVLKWWLENKMLQVLDQSYMFSTASPTAKVSELLGMTPS